MKFRFFFISTLLLFLLFLFFACKEKQRYFDNNLTRPKNSTSTDTVRLSEIHSNLDWSMINEGDGITLDIRYATINNFTNKIIYPCASCYLRTEVSQQIKNICSELRKEGYGLKLFDCYRPRPAQQKLWNIVPDASYVTPPSKGSMHNRGLAVDLTLTDLFGNELDMGTPYDYFGHEAHYEFTELPEEVLKRRRYLRKLMEKHGFKGIRTEWWHFSMEIKKYGFSDWEWPCE